MSRSRLFLMLLCGYCVAIAQPRASQDTVTRIFSYTLELREAAEKGDILGVDFDLRYEVARQSKIQSPQGHHFNFNLSATGFQDFDRAVEEFDHMRAEAVLSGRYYRAGLKPLDPFQQVRYGELFERDGKGDSLTAAEESDLKGLAAKLRNNRRYFSYDAHYRYETTQDLSVKQHVVGVALAGEAPLLHDLLDILAEALGPRYPGFKPQPVRVYLGVDYVAKRKGDSKKPETEIRGYPRARLEAAWKTLLLDEIVLRTTWEAQYLFDAPADFKIANREFNSFFQLWLERPLSHKFGVLAKYAEGRLPPLYVNTSEGKIGFRISLD